MAIQFLILIGSLFVLTFGAEFLVRGAAGVARKLGVSTFFIGLTIVGFGTSTPELATGVTAALKARTDAAYSDVNIGNVVGSNIFNIAVILGITALICPIPIKVKQVRSEVLIVVATAFLPLAALVLGGEYPRWFGVVLVALLLGFLVRGYIQGRQEGSDETAAEAELEKELGLDKPGVLQRTPAQIGLILTGLVALAGGSYFLVDSAVTIARSFGISELVIALTIVSAGTSAPELFTSFVAALRKQSDISVGNILGSSIFNVLGILGVSTIVTPQVANKQVLYLDVPVMIVSSLALLPIMLRTARIGRVEGGVMLVGYLVYLGVLFFFAPGWFGG